MAKSFWLISFLWRKTRACIAIVCASLEDTKASRYLGSESFSKRDSLDCKDIDQPLVFVRKFLPPSRFIHFVLKTPLLLATEQEYESLPGPKIAEQSISLILPIESNLAHSFVLLAMQYIELRTSPELASSTPSSSRMAER